MRNFKAFSVPLLILISFVLSSCASAPSHYYEKPKTTFEALLQPYLADPALDVANVGIFIQDPATRQIIYQQNQHRLFMPASNEKLVTTAAGLTTLGPDFKFVTRLYTAGTVENGVLHGNLYIVGSGDPTLSGRFHDGAMTRDLQNWADSLEAAGITKIDGDIIADANIFDDRRIGNGWAYDDLSYWYAAEISGLSFNDNCINVFITPGDSAGAPAHLEYEPKTSYITMENDLVTVPADSLTHYDYHRADGTNHMRFFGQISQSRGLIKDYITVHNPALYTSTVFSEVLSEQGITTAGKIREISYKDTIPEYGKMTQLVAYPSPPLSEIVEVINKKSQNFYAEQLFKLVGLKRTGEGSFSGGRQGVNSFLAGIGIETEHMHVMDGSGLSRRNLISPFQIGTVLRYMYSGKNSDYYLESLPIGGGDGTLGSRFKGSVAAGRVRAKTGYVGFVRSLSGYVQTKDDHQLIFSILVNHYVTNTSVINEFQDNVVTLLAAHTLDELTAPAGTQ